FGPVVQEEGHELDEWSFAWHAPPPRPLDSYDAVLVFGGAMHADQDEWHPWLREETLWLQQLLARQRPTLGICLGVQLLARAAGGVGDRLVRGRADGRGHRGSGARLAAAFIRCAPVAPLHIRVAGRRRRAGAERRVHAGVPPRPDVLGRPVPSGGDAGAAG